MDAHEEFTIFTDGGARGNPGPAAFAYIIQRPGSPAIKEKGFLGNATNNVAEYMGLVRALEHAEKLGARRLLINSDSELMVKQMNGEYQVKNAGLLPLYEQAMGLRRRFERVAIRHVRRESNKDADRLCNEALDAEEGVVKTKKPAAKPAARVEAARAEDLEARVRDDALACLQAAAGAWSRGDKQPAPEAVWEQLWSILVEASVLRK